jgi:Lrp/AsnC family transcriptional regulator
MDDMDLRILRVLQADSSLSVTDVAREVGLSASPCWKRINKLRADGVIRQQTAVLDAEQLGFGLTVFMELRTGEHSGDWLRSFAETVRAMPEVMEFHRMAGEVDYLLKVVVADMKRFVHVAFFIGIDLPNNGAAHLIANLDLTFTLGPEGRRVMMRQTPKDRGHDEGNLHGDPGCPRGAEIW